MNTRHILAVTAAALLSLPAVHAQAPATPAPATSAPAAAASGTAVPATGSATGAPAAEKKKPLSMSEGKTAIDLLETMQFYISMAQSGRHKDKEDKELVSFAGKTHKAMTELYTPLVTVAQESNLKNIPETVSKADKSDIAKLGKPKAEKWKEDYFELLAKKGKQDLRQLENALKSVKDPQLKDVATKLQAAIQTTATEAETKFKELKEKK